MKCTICTHAKRDEIDKAIINGDTIRNIAKRFNVSLSAVHRHSTNHVKDLLTKSKTAESLRADSLIEHLNGIQSQIYAILDEAEETDDRRTALQAIKEAREILEFKARLSGELKDRLNIESKNEHKIVYKFIKPKENNTKDSKMGV